MSTPRVRIVPCLRCRPDHKSRTGQAGVSIFERKWKRVGGVVTRRYFQAEMTMNGRLRKRSFCIDTLGYDAAYRAAVRCRERWKLELLRVREDLKPIRRARKSEADKRRIAANPGPRREYKKQYGARAGTRAANRDYWHRVGKHRRKQRLAASAAWNVGKTGKEAR